MVALQGIDRQTSMVSSLTKNEFSIDLDVLFSYLLSRQSLSKEKQSNKNRIESILEIHLPPSQSQFGLIQRVLLHWKRSAGQYRPSGYRGGQPISSDASWHCGWPLQRLALFTQWPDAHWNLPSGHVCDAKENNKVY